MEQYFQNKSHIWRGEKLSWQHSWELIEKQASNNQVLQYYSTE